MAHKNREKRAAKKEKEAAKTRARYEDDYDEDYDDDDEDEEYDWNRGYVRRRGPHPAIIAAIVTIVVIFGGIYGLNFAYDRSVEPIEPGNTEEITIEIPEGASTSIIASILKENGLIRNESFFRFHCKQKEYDGQFKQGIYTLTRSMSADEIAEELIKGTMVAETRRFTIPEGYNITQIARVLSDQGIVSELEFYNEVRDGDFDYAFLEGCPPGDERLEGFLYPETYEIYTDATAHDVVSKMLAQFDALFKDEYYAQAASMGLSVREIVTMGSIIERESIAAEERPVMAGVFYNRIEQETPLESCATIQYILGEAKEFLTIEDTQIESPYNTYLYAGLPPGPICNPRMASIDAALYPDDNDYIYFVLSADLDGTHRFSSDYNEFLRNKDAYYAAIEGREAEIAEAGLDDGADDGFDEGMDEGFDDEVDEGD
ncbi:MAG: endolytic transglycosylase MltG [Clostridiales bacterium]|nr:endolytic transglycosylase MltG [Clostridiales bacterium]